MAMHSKDRRRFLRLPFQGSGRITLRGKDYSFKLDDISLKGALVRIHPMPPDIDDNDEVDFRLMLPGTEADIEASACIAHRDASQLGLEFSMIDIDSITMLRRIIELNSGNAEEVDYELGYLGDQE